MQGSQAARGQGELPTLPPPLPARKGAAARADGASAHSEMLGMTEGMSVLQLDNTLERLKARLALRCWAVGRGCAERQ